MGQISEEDGRLPNHGPKPLPQAHVICCAPKMPLQMASSRKGLRTPRQSRPDGRREEKVVSTRKATKFFLCQPLPIRMHECL